jgi:hypothetical protein
MVQKFAKKFGILIPWIVSVFVVNIEVFPSLTFRIRDNSNHVLAGVITNPFAETEIRDIVSSFVIPVVQRSI